MKKRINKSAFAFLQKELYGHYRNGLISEEQMTNILNQYTVEAGFNFIKILVLIGSILIGLGVLSFVASNWQEMGNPLRFSLIVLLFTGANFASFRLKDNYPKVSQGLLYLSTFVYGAGIFLIGQMFHFGGHFTGAFLLWGIGVVPMAVIFRDKLIYLFAHVLFLVYLNGYFGLAQTPYFILLIVPALYYLNRYFDYSRVGTFFNNALCLNSVVLLGLEALKLDAAIVFLFLFVIGLAMFFSNIKFNQEVFKLQGSIVIGISGVVLTIEDVWRSIVNYDVATLFMVSFTLAFLTLLFVLVRKKNLIALIFICVTIFRFYVDTLLDFMPKSLFFITGGIILLGFGFYFEKIRKEKGGTFYE